MFENLIGQSQAKSLLTLMVRASRATSETFPHCLFSSGTGGTGKNTIIKEVAKELDVAFSQHSAQGTKPDHLARAIGTAGANGIIFIDEWNQPNRKLDNFLRSYIEENICLIPNTPTLIYPYKCSVIIATNNISCMSQPLQSRMTKVLFTDYTDDEILEIAILHAKRMKLNISYNGLCLIANRSKNIPRNVVKILELAEQKSRLFKGELDASIINDLCVLKGLGDSGLDSLDIQILQTLFKQPLSISSIAGMLNESLETIKQRESYLIKKGFVKIGHRREITPEGVAYINALPKMGLKAGELEIDL